MAGGILDAVIDVDKIQDEIFDISHGLEISPAAPQEKTQLGSPTLPQNPIAGTIYDSPEIPVITPAPATQKQIDAINWAIANGVKVDEVLKEFEE